MLLVSSKIGQSNSSHIGSLLSDVTVSNNLTIIQDPDNE